MNDEQLRTFKAAQYAEEFKNAAKEVIFSAVKLKNPHGKFDLYFPLSINVNFNDFITTATATIHISFV